MDHPEKISSILDQENYLDYHISESLLDSFLPVCGTYVHEKWYHMLDNTTFTFNQDEYVALKLHDEEAKDSEEVIYSREESDLYIYAKIVKLISCVIEGKLLTELSKYEVYVGEGRFLITSAYDIYKILRKKTDSRELVQAVDVANNSSTNTLPRQVIFKEVRRKLLTIWTLPDREKKAIFKRYLRQWHPDKNIGNEEQATDVFQYIMLVWDRLTNGDPVSVDDDVDASDYSQSRPTPNRQFYDDVDRHCSRERERYQESSRGGYRGSYYHDSDPVSNPVQQRKWFKQAELDLAAAEHFMKSTEEVQAYNWICYMSHQVRSYLFIL
ncbi:sacsin-like [Mizuhopecten yessoensis]|uniref:sacsin-like n=1 Tax=Mizuhopecten yessoensis TaxID=6573 RepID=UPI000B458EAB|nr:sacsin-like [Mizuhopecten yessoensis]